MVGLALGLLALHQLSHGRSLVTTDAAAAGLHAAPAALSMHSVESVGSVSVAGEHGHEVLSAASERCDAWCDHSAVSMVCLFVMALLMGRRLLRPPAVLWWSIRPREGLNRSLRRVRDRPRPPHLVAVSRWSLGISRT